MVTIILFAPLIGALIAGFGHRLVGDKGAQILTTALLFLSAALSWVVFLTLPEGTQHVQIMRWIESGTLAADWSVRLDRLTAIMLIVVTTVSSVVHLYSIGYMADDPQFKGESYRPRFFAYLSFFTFAMLALVTADNLLQMFFGWEGVGVASYLLIGFYYKKPSANAAAIKAFVVNRVGDFGFALGIFGVYYLTDSIRFDDVFAAAPGLAEMNLHFLWRDWNAANLLAFLLFIGAMGKSAQLFLHTWLPDAMEGPTPVSALIHAATMVTAGVFLVSRMSPLLEYAPEAKLFIVVIGAATAFVAATIGLVQNDIKRVIAYSTMSQLGYMFVAAGVGAYPVAMFHLLTHAFFKAMLFLGAGSVIHGMHHEQDMRNYGGLRSKMPLTFWAMLIGTLAITGVGIPLTTIGFAGFLSKDAIIEVAWAGTNGGFGFWALVIAALFTAFYSWRLMFMTFWGSPRGDTHTHEHAHESPTVMLVPLGVLAIGAVFAGMVWYGPFFGNVEKMAGFFQMELAEHEATSAEGEGAPMADEAAAEEAPATTEHGGPAMAPRGAVYMGPGLTVLEEAHAAPAWVKVSPFIAMVIGFVLAWWFYIVNPVIPKALARTFRPLYLFLLNKWYFDEAYDFLFVRPIKRLGRFLWKGVDGKIIDGFLNGVAMGIVPWFTRLAGRAQTGFIFTYAFAMVLGLVALVTIVTVFGGQ
ncbi:MAG TPA: NADH-quinone oxidoreductase subunit L [Aliiroseovarius sp.]|nr:NADH-quinone oxidoreductase subunit L [Aliiroseovarius sp.]